MQMGTPVFVQKPFCPGELYTQVTKGPYKWLNRDVIDIHGEEKVELKRVRIAAPKFFQDEAL